MDPRLSIGALTDLGIADVGPLPFIASGPGRCLIAAPDQDLAVSSAGRSISNGQANLPQGSYDGPLGYNWVIPEWPYIVETSGTVRSVYFGSVPGLGGSRTFAWDATSSSYLPEIYNANAWITQDTGAHTYTLVDRSGGLLRKIVFNDYDASNGAKKGVLKSWTDYNGVATTVVSYCTGGTPDELQKSITSGGTTTIWSILYTYHTSGTHNGKLQYATIRVKVGAGSWTNLRQASYAYYTGSEAGNEAYGNTNDLKTETEQYYNGGGWTDVGTRYYRYYMPVSVSGITRSSSTATATISAHGFANGDLVTIAGAVETEYNGTFAISNVTTNTFD